MGNVLIVEGIDRIGKTTLCRELSALSGIPIYSGKPLYLKEERDLKMEEEIINTTINMIEVTKASIILDRFIWSNIVYSTIKGAHYIGDKQYTGCKGYERFEDFEERLKMLGAKVLLLVPETEEELCRCSKEHGSDMKFHNTMFNSLIKESVVMNITIVNKQKKDGIKWMLEW